MLTSSVCIHLPFQFVSTRVRPLVYYYHRSAEKNNNKQTQYHRFRETRAIRGGVPLRQLVQHVGVLAVTPFGVRNQLRQLLGIRR